MEPASSTRPPRPLRREPRELDDALVEAVAEPVRQLRALAEAGEQLGVVELVRDVAAVRVVVGLAPRLAVEALRRLALVAGLAEADADERALVPGQRGAQLVDLAHEVVDVSGLVRREAPVERPQLAQDERGAVALAAGEVADPALEGLDRVAEVHQRVGDAAVDLMRVGGVRLHQPQRGRSRRAAKAAEAPARRRARPGLHQPLRGGRLAAARSSSGRTRRPSAAPARTSIKRRAIAWPEASAECARRMSAAAVAPRRSRLLAVVEDLAQQPRGVVEVGLGPLRLGRVGIAALADRLQLVVDEVGCSRAA